MPTQRNGVWYANIRTGNGQRLRVSLGKAAKKQDAIDYEARVRRERVDEVFVGKVPQRLISEAFQHWLDGDGARLKSSDNITDKLRTIAPYIAGQKLTGILACVDRAKKAWIKEGLAIATINSRLRLLRRVANLAFEWGWLKEPLGRKIKCMSGEAHRQIFLTPEEFADLAAACPDPVVAEALTIYVNTGLRRKELFNITKRQIQGDEINLGVNTKSLRARVIPVLPHIVPLLEKLPLAMTNDQLRRNFEIARYKIGMGPKPAESQKARQGKRPVRVEPFDGITLRLHDLRHTYASWLIQNGVNLTHVRDLLGHSTIAITADFYSHLETRHLREAVALLPKPVVRLRVVK